VPGFTCDPTDIPESVGADGSSEVAWPPAMAALERSRRSTATRPGPRNQIGSRSSAVQEKGNASVVVIGASLVGTHRALSLRALTLSRTVLLITLRAVANYIEMSAPWLVETV
jgi:hypothetical protein